MRNKKGISMVALVITIIVLVILAGTAIITLVNGGIIGNAKEARDRHNRKQAYELVQREVLAVQMKNPGKSILEIDEELQTKLRKTDPNAEVEKDTENNKLKIKYTLKGNKEPYRYILTDKYILLEEEKIVVKYDLEESKSPSETGLWNRKAGYYKFKDFGLSNETVINKDDQNQELEDPYILIVANHIYQRLTYEVKNYMYADNCSMEIKFSDIILKGDSSASGISILLSDGEKATQCLIGPTTFRVAPYSNPKYPNSYIVEGMDNKNCTLKVIKNKYQAKYYINGELIYTQTELFDIDDISLNIPTAANNKTGYTWSSDKANSFSVVASSEVKIYSAEYKQW